MKNNPAYNIATYFLKKTKQNTTANLKKTLNQANRLLDKGYSENDIINSIDLVIEKGINIYSLGYITTCIDDCLKELQAKQYKDKLNKIVTTSIDKLNCLNRNEVIANIDSKKRNRTKLNRFGIQSRFGEKFNFNMLKR